MIRIFTVGEVNKLTLEPLVKPINEAFNQRVEVGITLDLVKNSWNPQRQQYQSDSILDSLPIPPPGDRHLGILGVDIYAFGLNFVFGEADINIKKAVISLARLRPEFYGLSPDDSIFKARILIEAIHELGHTYGLKHCPSNHCVMHFSNSIQDTDIKGANFCPICHSRLLNNLDKRI